GVVSRATFCGRCEASLPPDSSWPIRYPEVRSRLAGIGCHSINYIGASSSPLLAVRRVRGRPRRGGGPAGRGPGTAYRLPALPYHDEFQRGLRELGYVEGRNIIIEYRFADGKFDRLSALAAELVQLDVDVIVSVVTQASLAAKNATRTIPIVFVSVGDPVGAG